MATSKWTNLHGSWLDSPSTGVVMFRHQAVVAALFALTSLLQPQAGHAAGDNRADREAVADLIYCYARGTDAIGDATTNADPLATGLAIYRGCFAEDAEFRAWFPQQPFDSQTFPNPDANPDTAPAPFIGPAAWAEFVNGVFRGSGYDFTQHIMSNVDVQLNGNRALLTAYLNASHVISGDAIGGSVALCRRRERHLLDAGGEASWPLGRHASRSHVDHVQPGVPERRGLLIHPFRVKAVGAPGAGTPAQKERDAERAHVDQGPATDRAASCRCSWIGGGFCA